jgi:hypothetical protein
MERYQKYQIRSAIKNKIRLLRYACVCCLDCGDKYGEYTADIPAIWEDKCDICFKVKPATDVQDYGYLAVGLKRLYAERYGLFGLNNK